ncbi:MAG: AbrB/MazE/SpoVT family DNA-binding domain-containing protein [Verrucomicrobiota bacterium]|jgi:AbrB family looped-hinge helix DNA binding protein
MTTRVSSKGQIVLPAKIRRQDRIEPGQELEIEGLDCGEYRLVRQAPPANAAVVDWLLAALRGSHQAMPIKDSLIAATALAHGLTVGTRHERAFAKTGVRVVNPFV